MTAEYAKTNFDLQNNCMCFRNNKIILISGGVKVQKVGC